MKNETIETKNKEQLQNDIFKLLILSSMNDDERMMWMILVPNMNETEMTKFKSILEKEIKKLTKIYASAIKSK